MWQQYNANPINKRVGDCTVRAISKALDQTWGETYAGLAVQGYTQCDMPSANNVWGAYLRRNGFTRHIIPDECPDCYTVEDFCRDNPKGTFLLALDSHVLAVMDGIYYDTWDSGGEIPIFYWKRKDD
jgi:hypothetical protein